MPHDWTDIATWDQPLIFTDFARDPFNLGDFTLLRSDLPLMVTSPAALLSAQDRFLLPPDLVDIRGNLRLPAMIDWRMPQAWEFATLGTDVAPSLLLRSGGTDPLMNALRSGFGLPPEAQQVLDRVQVDPITDIVSDPQTGSTWRTVQDFLRSPLGASVGIAALGLVGTGLGQLAAGGGGTLRLPDRQPTAAQMAGSDAFARALGQPSLANVLGIPSGGTTPVGVGGTLSGSQNLEALIRASLSGQRSVAELMAERAERERLADQASSPAEAAIRARALAELPSFLRPAPGGMPTLAQPPIDLAMINDLWQMPSGAATGPGYVNNAGQWVSTPVERMPTATDRNLLVPDPNRPGFSLAGGPLPDPALVMKGTAQMPQGVDPADWAAYIRGIQSGGGAAMGQTWDQRGMVGGTEFLQPGVTPFTGPRPGALEVGARGGAEPVYGDPNWDAWMRNKILSYRENPLIATPGGDVIPSEVYGAHRQAWFQAQPRAVQDEIASQSGTQAQQAYAAGLPFGGPDTVYTERGYVPISYDEARSRGLTSQSAQTFGGQWGGTATGGLERFPTVTDRNLLVPDPNRPGFSLAGGPLPDPALVMKGTAQMPQGVDPADWAAYIRGIQSGGGAATGGPIPPRQANPRAWSWGAWTGQPGTLAGGAEAPLTPELDARVRALLAGPEAYTDPTLARLRAHLEGTLAPAQPLPDEIQAALGAEIARVTRGEVSNPTLERRLVEEERTQREFLARTLGPNYELATAGQAALGELRQRHQAVREEDRRTTLATLSPLEESRRRFGVEFPEAARARALGLLLPEERARAEFGYQVPRTLRLSELGFLAPESRARYQFGRTQPLEEARFGEGVRARGFEERLGLTGFGRRSPLEPAQTLGQLVPISPLLGIETEATRAQREAFSVQAAIESFRARHQESASLAQQLGSIFGLAGAFGIGRGLTA